jgi:putative ABC transport system substrate-binding protein
VKFIGVYSSEERARAAVDRAKQLSGFRDYPDGFSVDPYEVDMDHWTEGFLKEAIPSASRVAVLWSPAEPGRQAHAREAEIAARGLGLHAQLVGAASPGELDSAFTTMGRAVPDAILVQPSQTNLLHRARIAELAAKHRLPTMGWSAETAEAGWLMSYGPDVLSLYRRAAYYVERILRGTKPADLAVEQPIRFELVINLKTAKTLGLTIPPSLLLRADRVIE